VAKAKPKPVKKPARFLMARQELRPGLYVLARTASVPAPAAPVAAPPPAPAPAPAPAAVAVSGGSAGSDSGAVSVPPPS
jgi:hypothetical protein